MILNINDTETHNAATLIAMLIAKLFKLDFEGSDEALKESSYDDVGSNYCAVYSYTSVKDVEKLEEAMKQVQDTCSKLLNGTKLDPKKSFGWSRKPKWTYRNTAPISIKFKCSRWEELMNLELSDEDWKKYLTELGLDNTTSANDDSDY